MAEELVVLMLPLGLRAEGTLGTHSKQNRQHRVQGVSPEHLIFSAVQFPQALVILIETVGAVVVVSVGGLERPLFAVAEKAEEDDEEEEDDDSILLMPPAEEESGGSCCCCWWCWCWCCCCCPWPCC